MARFKAPFSRSVLWFSAKGRKGLEVTFSQKTAKGNGHFYKMSLYLSIQISALGGCTSPPNQRSVQLDLGGTPDWLLELVSFSLGASGLPSWGPFAPLGLRPFDGPSICTPPSREKRRGHGSRATRVRPSAYSGTLSIS